MILNALRKIGYIFTQDNELSTIFRKNNTDEKLIIIYEKDFNKWIIDHKYELDNPELNCKNTVISVYELQNDIGK